MKFTKISIRNFLTLGNAEARLDSRGLVLVQGENQDDSSQDSNGAGKSSLADAVSWVLFGITARGDSGSEVINNKVKRGGASVTLDIDDNGTHYRITRTRTKSKGTLELSRKDGANWVSMTKGTTKLTQEAINRLIGCGPEVFNNAIYAGQEKTPDLPGMTDKALKMLIEEAAGINRLERAYKVARERLGESTKALQAKEDLLSLTEQRVKEQGHRIDGVRTQIADWDDRRQAELRSAMTNIKSLQEQAVKAERHYTTLNAQHDKIKAELSRINKRLDSLTAYQQAVHDAQRALSDAQIEAQAAGREIEHIITVIRRLRAEYDAAENLVGSPCDSCGKPYTDKDIAPKRDRLSAELNRLARELKQVREAKDRLDEKVALARSERQKAVDAIPDTAKEIKRRDELLEALKAITQARHNAESAATRVRDHLAHLKRLKAEANPYRATLDTELKAMDKLKADRDSQRNQVEELKAQVQVRKAAVNVFGPAGVRAHILDTVTPFLNDRTNHYLMHLTDGNISALWSTISANAKGEVKEKFAIDVRSKVGALTFRGLSGGEKRKVRLACAMALQDLVSSRASKPIELFIADEIDHALDDSGLERLMGILEEKAEHRGTVLVISHQSLSDWISQSVTVVKKSGVSHLEGDALA